MERKKRTNADSERKMSGDECKTKPCNDATSQNLQVLRASSCLLLYDLKAGKCSVRRRRLFILEASFTFASRQDLNVEMLFLLSFSCTCFLRRKFDEVVTYLHVVRLLPAVLTPGQPVRGRRQKAHKLSLE